METLNKLTKQIDALTWNARSVTNALIRSTLASGSYNGYKVRRNGTDIVLNRTEIYRLYTFYQEWENHVDGPYMESAFDDLLEKFDDVLAKADSKDTTNVREALVKHSKIMFMSTSNASHADEESYWLDKLKTASDPKLITNSCPIPINIRTPIYDENLSTKHYSQYETYLFPTGYYSMALLGQDGDGTDHIGGGKSWTFTVDDQFSVSAYNVLLGFQDDAETKSLHGYNGKWNLSLGLNSYAYGAFGVAGGMYSVSSNIAFSWGGHNAADGFVSVALGGQYNRSIYSFTTTIGGYTNTATGLYGIASGYRTSVGGARFDFTRRVTTTVETVHVVDPDDDDDVIGNACDEEIIVGDCTYQKIIDAGASTNGNTTANVTTTTEKVVNSTELATNQIVIPVKSIYENGFEDIYGARLNAMNNGYPDFIAGDQVLLYDFGVSTNRNTTNPSARFYNKGAYWTEVIFATVKSIERVDGDIIVTLDKDITETKGMTITCGSISMYCANKRTGLPTLNDYGDSTMPTNIQCGYASAALNYKTIAMGYTQTVVGASNLGMFEPNFIVGAGEIVSGAGITNNKVKTNTPYRHNSFMSGPTYTVMSSPAAYIVSGISTHNNDDLRNITGNYLEDELSHARISILDGAFSIARSSSGIGISHMCSSCAEFTVSSLNDSSVGYSDGLLIHPLRYTSGGYIPGSEMRNKMISTLLTSNTGSIVLSAGNDGGTPMFDHFDLGGTSSAVEHSIGLYAYEQIKLYSRYKISIVADGVHFNDSDNNGVLSMSFKKLRLTGKTYAALPTRADSRSFNLVQTDDTFECPSAYTAFNLMSHSGFYFGTQATAAHQNSMMPNQLSWDSECGAYHVICSARNLNGGVYGYRDDAFDESKPVQDVAGFIIPGLYTKDTSGTVTKKPHVKVFSNTIQGDGNYGINGYGSRNVGTLYDELAYMSDLTDTSAAVTKQYDDQIATLNSSVATLNTRVTNVNDSLNGKVTSNITHNWGGGSVVSMIYQDVETDYKAFLTTDVAYSTMYGLVQQSPSNPMVFRHKFQYNNNSSIDGTTGISGFGQIVDKGWYEKTNRTLHDGDAHHVIMDNVTITMSGTTITVAGRLLINKTFAPKANGNIWTPRMIIPMLPPFFVKDAVAVTNYPGNWLTSSISNSFYNDIDIKGFLCKTSTVCAELLVDVQLSNALAKRASSLDVNTNIQIPFTLHGTTMFAPLNDYSQFILGSEFADTWKNQTILTLDQIANVFAVSINVD